MNIDIFTLFPGWFDWFREQRHVRNALTLGHALEAVDLRATTPLKAGQVDDTPYGGGAGMVIRVDVVESALEARYGPDRDGRRVIALAAGARRSWLARVT
jgi:tRNA (guanine37-N1)-methyltransferase